MATYGTVTLPTPLQLKNLADPTDAQDAATKAYADTLKVDPTRIANGTSNVAITTTNGNVTVGVGGVDTVLTITGTGTVVKGSQNVSGNLISSGNLMVGLPGSTVFLGNTSNIRVYGGTTGQYLKLTSAAASTTVSLQVQTTDLTITVVSTTGFTTSGYIIIDSEVIAYTGVTATTFTGCTRGQLNSTIAGHSTATTVYNYSGGTLSWASVDATKIFNGTSNVSVALDGDVTVGVSGTAGVVTIKNTGVNIAGYANLGSGNLLTTGNANAGNFNATSQFVSTVATGTAPLVVNSTTLVPNLNAATANVSTNLSGGAAGSVAYQTAANTTAMLAAGTTGQYLQTTGTGLQWATLNADKISNGTSVVNVTSATGPILANISGTTIANIVGTGIIITGNANASSFNATSQFVSTLVTGTAPLSVNSTTLVPNLYSARANVSDFGVVTTQTTGTFYPVFVSGSTTGNYALASNANIKIDAASGQLSATSMSATDLTLSGNLTVSGTTTTVNSTTTRVVDPIIEFGGGTSGAVLTTNDSKDRGTLLHYYTTQAVDAFMGWDNSNAEFAFASNVTLASEVATFNSFGNVRANNFIGTGVIANGHTASGAVTGNANVSTVSGVLGFRAISSTYTDNVAAPSATIANAAIHAIDTPTLAATNTAVTFTNAATLFIKGAPTAGTNATLTNPYALYVGSGNSYLGGNLAVGGIILSSGGTTGATVVANSHTISGAASGNANVSVVTGNLGLRAISSTYTDNLAAPSTTIANAAIHALDTPILAATNTAVTFTNASTLFIKGAPTAGTNATLTNPYALYVGSGNSYFAGNVIAGNLIGSHANGNSNVNIPSANGNVTISAVGNANIVTVTGTGVNIAGYANLGSGIFTTTGNISGGNVIGIIAAGSNTITTTGNISGGNVIGIIAAGSNTITTTGNANVGNLGFGSGIITGTGNITGGNIIGIIAAGSNTITTTGNISGGNITGGNIIGIIAAGSNTITTTGNISGGNFIGPLASGTSNINIASGGNIQAVVAGSVIANISSTGITVNGTLTLTGSLINPLLLQGFHQTVTTPAVGTYNLSTSTIFYHSTATTNAPVANFTVAITNLPTITVSDSRTSVVTILIQQGATPYIPNAVTVGGVSATFKWVYGITPPGTANALDVFALTIIRINGAVTIVTGSYSTYL